MPAKAAVPSKFPFFQAFWLTEMLTKRLQLKTCEKLTNARNCRNYCTCCCLKNSGVRGGEGSSPPRLEKFRANFAFQSKCKLFKILNNEKYIFNAVNSRRALFFRASASCSKFWIIKKYIFNTMNSRHTLFFRTSASCLTFWMIKNSIQWIQGKLCYSGQAQVVQNSVW